MTDLTDHTFRAEIIEIRRWAVEQAMSITTWQDWNDAQPRLLDNAKAIEAYVMGDET